MDAAAISAADLARLLEMSSGAERPLVVDVRRNAAFTASDDLIAGALRRDPEAVDRWSAELPKAASVAVYCMHGHEVSQATARALRAQGLDALYLEHGLEGWRECGGRLARKPAGGPTAWVTRERPKIDRIACPWLIARFVDPGAQFLYVPAADVRRVAIERRAEPYDIPEATFGHRGERCSFDAFVEQFSLGADPALAALATIVRGADTGVLELAPQAPGLLCISLGLSRLYADDHRMLAHGMVMYDALYRWCKEGQDEARTWNPTASA